MATAYKVHIDAKDQPAFSVAGLSQQSADTASKVLQDNVEKNHIFFNANGFHVGAPRSQHLPMTAN